MAALQALEHRVLLAAVAWDGGGDGQSWDDPLNWDTDSLPGTDDDVTIDVPGDPSIVLDSGAGAVVVNSLHSEEFLNLRVADLTLNADSVFAAGADLSFATLDGTGGIALSGVTSTNQTRITGSGSVRVNPGARLDVFSLGTTINAPLQNAGTVRTFGNVFGSSNITNEATGDWMATTDGSLSLTADAFANQGTFQKSGDATLTVDTRLTFDNTGTIHLTAGELVLGAGSTTTSLQVPVDTTLQLTGDFDYAPGTQLGGAGRIEFTGGRHEFTDTELLPTGTVTFVSGSVFVGNTLPETAVIDQIRTAVTFDADQVLDSVDAAFGRVDGTGNLAFRGISVVNQTRFEGTGIITVEPEARLDVFSLGVSLHQQLVNQGRVRFFGNLSGTGDVVNEAEGAMELPTDTQVTLTADRFLNQGSFRKSGNSFSSLTVADGFDHRGTLVVESGTLRIAGAAGALPASGTFDVRSGAALGVSNDLELLADGVLTGSGLFEDSVRSSGTVRPGSPLGRLTIDGSFTQTPDGVLEVEIGGRTAGTDFDQLDVAEFGVLEGTLTVLLAGGFSPAAGDNFSVGSFSNTDGSLTRVNLPDIAPLEFVASLDNTALTLSVQRQETAGIRPEFRGTAAPGSDVTITANSETLGTTTANAEGRWTFRPAEPLSDDEYRMAVAGDGPARFDLTTPLDVGDGPVPDLNGLTVTDDGLILFPFGADQDGILEADDILLAAEDSRLALPVAGFTAAGTLDSLKRRLDGRLLINQDEDSDPVADVPLVNEQLLADVGLAGVLPFRLKSVDIRNIDLSDGFSAEFVATGTFDAIDFSTPVPEPERVSREDIRAYLKEQVDPDPIIIASLLQPMLTDIDEGVVAVLGPDGPIAEDMRTVEDLQQAEQALAYAFRFEAELDTLGIREEFVSDDERAAKLAEMFRLRDEAPQIVVDSAVALANGKPEPTADDFAFVEAILSFASAAEQNGLPVSSVETLDALTPSIENEIRRLQEDAVSQREIADGVDHASIVATAGGDDSGEAATAALKTYIDTFIARVAAGDQQPLKLANTAVRISQELAFTDDISSTDPMYGPDAVVDRIRDFLPDYEFDPENLLPDEPPPPEPFPPSDDPRAFVLIGDLPLDENGKLTTEGVRGLLRDVPQGVSRIAPLQNDLEFSFAVNNGSVVPVNLPTLTVAFDNLTFGDFVDAAGFVSLGSYGEDGTFEKATFAGGLDIEARFAGLEASLGVTMDGTSEGRGFFPREDLRGGTIVTTTTVDLDFTTPEGLDGFFLDVEDAQLTFDMRMQIDATRSFAFEQFDLTSISVDRFVAAFGGTAPAAGESPIPEDALLQITSADVAVNLTDENEPLLQFGLVSVELPNADPLLQALSAEVTGFGIDVRDGRIALALGSDFGFRFTGVEQVLRELGIPDIVQVDALGFDAGPEFFDADGAPDNVLDFSLLVSAGISLPDPIPLPVRAEVRGMRIDVGALSQGQILNAVSIDEGVRAAIGPIDFGGALQLEGDFRLDVIEYDQPGGEVGKSLLLDIGGFVGLPGLAGIGANVVISELGPVAFGLEADLQGGAEIPIGNTGVSVKRLAGRVVLNPPRIRDVRVPLDLFRESEDPGVVDFSDLAGPLDSEALLRRTRDLLEANAAQGGGLRTWTQPLLFAVDVGLGITGDPVNTMQLDTTVGARIDPNAEELDLRIFGLGSLAVMPGSPQELILGRAGVLLDFQGNDTTVSLGLRTGGEELGIDAATITVGAQFIQKDAFRLFELRLQGEVSVDGFTGQGPDGSTTPVAAGGVLILERDVGLYGAVQATVEINQPGDSLYLGGEVFVRFNTNSEPQAIDPDVARELVPQLVQNGEAIIPSGFGLYAAVDVGVGSLLEGSATLELEINSSQVQGSLDLEGTVFSGIVSLALQGDLLLDIDDGDLTFRRLAATAFFEVVLIDDFLEARGDGDLLITDAGLQTLTFNSQGVVFGLPFGAADPQDPDAVAALIDKHGCVELALGGGRVEFPLPGGECGAVDEPDPTRLVIPDATFLERDTTRSVNLPVRFEGGQNQILVPEEFPPKIVLEYWAVSRPDDTAVGLAASGDYRRLERATVDVLGTNPRVVVPGLRVWDLPRTVDLPLDIFGDRSIEADETFSVFVQPVIPGGVVFSSLVRDDGFARVTLENDDFEVPPPEDAVVFFDFDRLVRNPVTGFEEFRFEAGPDASRPELTFDLSQVSAIRHTADDVSALSGPQSGLPREQGVSRAAVGETWLVPALQDTANDRDRETLAGEAGSGPPPTLNVASQREHFEFTITTPPAAIRPGRDTTVLTVTGIDFHDFAEIGGTEWQVTYSLDNFTDVLASGATHGGTFGRNRVTLDFPTGFSPRLPSGTDITFRLSGPQPLTPVDPDPLPWAVDNLALIGSARASAFLPKPPPDTTFPLPGRTSGRTTTEKDSSGTTTTRKDPVREAVNRAAERATRIGKLRNGFASGAEVFFDANGNRRPDFIDQNANGVQDPGEPDEPRVITDAGGLFEMLVPAAFDQDADGVITTADGVLVSRGGIDQGTGLSLPLRFRAPAGAASMSPLTSLITALATTPARTVIEAADQVRSGLLVDGLPLDANADLLHGQPITEINQGNARAIPEYLALLQVHNTAWLIAAALSDGESDGPAAMADAGDAVFRAIAEELDASGPLSLTDPRTLRAIQHRTAMSMGRQLPDELTQAVTDVIRNANRSLGSTELPPGLPLLQMLKRQQRAILTLTADDIRDAVAGELPASELRERNTTTALAARAASQPEGTVFPVALSMENAVVAEPDHGTVAVEFPVRLSAPTTLPVTVDFDTQGRSASSRDGDFLTVAGSLTFAPGQTEQSIVVHVAADAVEELAEVFHVWLRNPQHALLQATRATGTILPPAATDVLPAEFSLGADLSAIVNQPVDISFTLPQIVSGDIDWGDGTTESVSLEGDGDRIRIRAAHEYQTAGRQDVTLTLTNAAGATSVGRGVIEVQQVASRPDPTDPTRRSLTLSGTDGHDLIRILHDGSAGRLTAEINGRAVGTFDSSLVSRITILARDGHDRILVDRQVTTAIVLAAGAGNDLVVTGRGDDDISGGPGHDWLITGDGDDRADGGEGNDVLFGHAGDDRLTGGSGRDWLVGGDGDDQLQGGPGSDRLDGGDGRDLLRGGDGSDHIFGRSGDDVLLGESGNDLLRGSHGNDYLHGGDGHDLADGGPDRDVVLGGNDSNAVRGGSGDDRVSGGDDHDLVTGDSGNDVITGGDGNDLLSDGDGDDVVLGESGHDLLRDGDGNDVLVGGDGHDRLIGRRGRNILIGGTGRDRLFSFGSQDLIITGRTLYDDDPDRLTLLNAEWASSRSRDERIDHLRNGTGPILNNAGVWLRRADTVFDDSDRDRIFGDDELDWLLFDVSRDRR